jgi:hypothetical protein
VPQIAEFPFRNGSVLFVTMLPGGPAVHIEQPSGGAPINRLGRLSEEQALALAESLIASYRPADPLPTNEASKPVPFFLVWSPTGLRPPQFRHLSREGADTEAGRLASSHAGGEFYTLAPVSMVKLPASPVREEYAYSTENDRPF